MKLYSGSVVLVRYPGAHGARRFVDTSTVAEAPGSRRTRKWMKLDFSVNSSVQSDLSTPFAVTVASLTEKQEGDDQSQTEQPHDVDGQVTAVGTD